MKKNWKIIVGIIFLIGGFGNVPSNVGAAAFGTIVGISLIAWWVLDRKRISDKQNITTETARHTNQPMAATDKPVVSPVRQSPAPGITVQMPQTKDGAPLAYKYNISFVLSNNGVLDALTDHLQLRAKKINQDIHLFYEEVDLGILTERADMVSDWLRRGDPYLATVDHVIGESCHIILAFYRDKQKQYANNEQTIIALTGYKAEQKQDIITSLAMGDELEAEEDYEKEDRVVVSYTGDAIGSLPKKYAVRFINEGAALIVFDHCDEDEDTFICKPFVKIYW